MNTFLTIAIIVSMASVLAALGLGLFGMLKGGEFNKKYGNKLMQARVFLQGIALSLLALAYFISAQ